MSPGGDWNATARIARLTSRLQEFSFKVEHVIVCPECHVVWNEECEKWEVDRTATIKDVVENEFEGID